MNDFDTEVEELFNKVMNEPIEFINFGLSVNTQKPLKRTNISNKTKEELNFLCDNVKISKLTTKTGRTFERFFIPKTIKFTEKVKTLKLNNVGDELNE